MAYMGEQSTKLTWPQRGENYERAHHTGGVDTAQEQLNSAARERISTGWNTRTTSPLQWLLVRARGQGVFFTGPCPINT